MHLKNKSEILHNHLWLINLKENRNKMKKLKEEKSNQVVKGTQAIFNYEKSEASEIRCEKSCKVSLTRSQRSDAKTRTEICFNKILSVLIQFIL